MIPVFSTVLALLSHLDILTISSFREIEPLFPKMRIAVTQDDRVFALIASVITGYFGWSRGNGDRSNSQ
jgi:hypothetical protein